MPHENKHTGDADKLVQADTVQGGVHFHDHRTRVRRRTWLVVLVCVLGLVTASAVVLIRFQQAPSTGVAPGQAQPRGAGVPHGEEPATSDEAFVRAGDCPAPAAPARKSDQGRLFNFMRTNDDTVVQNNQTADFERSRWIGIGGRAQGQPVAACGANDRMVVLAIAEGELKMHSEITEHDGESFNSPEAPRWNAVPAPRGSGGLVGVPAAVRDAQGALAIVAKGNNGSVWERRQNQPDAGWIELPRPVDDDPAIPAEDDPSIVLDSENRLRVFTAARGEARAYTQEPGSRTWQRSADQPGTIDDPASDIRTTPSVSQDGSGCLHLFAVTGTGTIARTKENDCSDATWGDWTDMGMGHSGNRFVQESPITTRGPDDDIVVFAVDSAHELFESRQDLGAEGEWKPWTTHDDVVQHLVAVTPDIQDKLVAHGLGADDDGNVSLWVQNQDPESEAGDWTEWSRRISGAGVLHSDPNCIPQEEC
ncbi:hypothetical protein IQ251_13165 [Saccharopolyspora sp. HNM0983]|uniref:PLL-like beta propeller domain-containing protein n=1 Tax=Saccharopolyspora montiporae TaxID=2781240 RepID=A0A929FY54_9PSEU|nr:hypothetical protein [Saccharopolyspora sp. HNM0983]MBE9375396.1 hypothetical protein [Saccharopolyspora sp. HNM0983]